MSNSSGSSTTAAATGTPIKVGLICSCSGGGGFGAFNLPGEQVYKSWVNTVNASGGINGHSVQLITQDDGSNPGTAISAAQSLIGQHVAAIVDISLVDQAFEPAVTAAKIPVVGVLTISAPFLSSPYFYAEGQTNDTTLLAVAMTAKAAGAKNLGDMYCAESSTCQQSVQPLEAAGKQLGVPVVYNAQISATAPNYTAQCVAARQQHVDGLFIGDASAVITRVSGDCAQQGYNPTYVTEGAGFGMVMASAPGTRDNTWSEYSDLPFYANNPQMQAMKAAMDKYFPGVVENANLFLQDAAMAWTSGVLLEHAIKASGLTANATPSSTEVLQGLNRLKNDNLEGLAPPLTFTAGQVHKVDCWFTGRIQNGTPTLANNGQVTCAHGTSGSSS